MSLKRIVVVAIAFALMGVHSASAALQITSESDIAPDGGAVHDPFQPTFAGGSASSADLLEGMLPTSTTGNLTYETSAGPVALTDGSDATVWPEGGLGGDDIDHAGYATGEAGASVTYALGGRYDISSLVVYGGWGDGGRDEQHFDVLTSTDGGVSFTLLGTFDGMDGESGGNPIGHRTEFIDDTLPNVASIAENVTNLQIGFLEAENGFTGYSEIDLFGDLVDVPGDANLDGFVTIDDFYVISDHFLQIPSAIRLDGDINASGFVDEADFREWKDIFSGLGSGSLVAELNGLNIPEPASLAVAAVVVMLVGMQRFWRRR